MSHLKQLITACVLLFSITSYSQSTNQIIIYVANGVSNSALDNAAALLNSTVNTYNDPGENIALLDWNGPFTINGLTINTIAEVASYIASDNTQPPGGQTLPEIDGGVENYYNTFPGKDAGAPEGNPVCVSPISKKYIASSNIYLGIFDTGVEYNKAKNYGYTFENVIEINGPVDDNNGHGTHIGTIIDESYHNTIIGNPLNYLIGNPFNTAGQSTISQVFFDMEDALIAGVDVMNCSFSYIGGEETSDPLYLLLSSEIAQNTLVVAAAGNDGVYIPASGDNLYFPASLSLDNVLSVGSYYCRASHKEVIPKLSKFSNYSPIHIDILAPGEDILSMNHLGQMVHYSGTSQSTAFVSAAAAMIGSRLQSFDASTVKCIILTYAEVHQSLNNIVESSGVLDLATAIEHTSCTAISVELRNDEKNPETFESNFYPNPFNDIIELELTVDKSKAFTYSIFSVTGQLLGEYKSIAELGKNEISINFTEIPFYNQYLVRVSTDESTTIKKLIRQR